MIFLLRGFRILDTQPSSSLKLTVTLLKSQPTKRVYDFRKCFRKQNFGFCARKNKTPTQTTRHMRRQKKLCLCCSCCWLCCLHFRFPWKCFGSACYTQYEAYYESSTRDYAGYRGHYYYYAPGFLV